MADATPVEEVDLAFLAALTRIEGTSGSLGDQEVDLAKSIASERGDTPTEETLDYLEEGGYLARNDGGWTVKGQGRALVQAAAEDRLGRTFLDRASMLGAELDKRSASGRKSLIEDLPSSVSVSEDHVEDRFESVPGRDIHANCGIYELRTDNDQLTELVFRHSAFTHADEGGARKIAKDAVTGAEEKLGLLLPSRIDGDRLRVWAPRESLFLYIDNDRVDGEPVGTVSMEEVPANWAVVVKRAVKRRFKDLGWRAAGRLAVLDLTTVKHQDTGAGTTQEFPRVKIWVDQIGENRFAVWLEEDRKITVPLSNLIEDWRASGRSRPEIEKQIQEMELNALPRSYNVDVVGVVWDDDPADHQLDEGRTLQEFWAEEHGLDVDPDQPLVMVRFPWDDLAYPAQAVYPERRSLESEVGSWEDRTPHTPGGNERRRRGQELLQDLAESGGSLRTDPYELVLEDEIPPWAALDAEGFTDELERISEPTLEFGSHETETDPMQVFEEGPYSGRKPATIGPILIPEGLGEAEALEGVRKLASALGRYGFMDIDRATDDDIVRYDSTDKTQIEELAARTPAPPDEAKIAVAILPRWADTYYDLKRAFQTQPERPLPVQVMKPSTLHDLRDGPTGVARNLSIKIYAKLAEEGEAIWTLEGPSDRGPHSTYVGIGFSQDPHGSGTKAKCAAVLCDPYGRDLRWNMIPPAQAPRYIERGWFQRVLAPFREDLDRPNTKRMVVYRKGNVYPEEVKAMREGLDGLDLQNPPTIEIVEVRESFRRMLGTGDGVSAGHLAVLGDDEAVLTLTEPFQGTVQPLLLNRKSGETPVRELAREYLDQTRLLWTAAGVKNTNTLVNKIAEKMARFGSRIPGDEPVDHLPL